MRKSVILLSVIGTLMVGTHSTPAATNNPNQWCACAPCSQIGGIFHNHHHPGAEQATH